MHVDILHELKLLQVASEPLYTVAKGLTVAANV